MKYFLFTILISTFIANIASAQILDTISQKQFIHYSFNDYKRIYKDGPKELKIVTRFHRKRIIAYYLYGATVLLLPTADIGPFPLITLVVAGEFSFRNTKRQLYDQLKTYEKYNFIKPLKSKIDSNLTENLSPQKTADSLFTISFSDFKNLDYEKIKSKYNINDTTHLMLKLYERTKLIRDGSVGSSIFYPALGIIFYNSMSSKNNYEESNSIILGFETFIVLTTAIFIPIAINSINHSSREYLYYSLQNYFNHHTLDERTQKYISHHTKNIKY